MDDGAVSTRPRSTELPNRGDEVAPIGRVEPAVSQPPASPDMPPWLPPLRLAANGIPLLVSLFYLWQAFALPDAPNAVVSPRAYPITIGVFTVAISVYLLAEALISGRRSRSILEDPESAAPADSAPAGVDEPPTDWRREQAANLRYVSVMVAVVVVGLASFERLGAAVATFVFIAGLATVAERSRWRRNMLVAGAFALASDYAFRHGLDVYLPTGPWS